MNEVVMPVVRQCRKCKRLLPPTKEFFPIQRGDHLRLDCRPCYYAERNEKLKQQRKGVKEDVGRLPVVDDRCSCCGTIKGNILGDIDETTQEPYGYLCAKCFRLVHDFHADLDRMRLVVKYLTRTEQARKMKHSS